MSNLSDPSATQEYPIFPDTPLNRVHRSIYEIRRCPICQHRIDQLDPREISINEIIGFALKD